MKRVIGIDTLIIKDNVNIQVYDYLKRMILEQQFKPGQRIDSKGLAMENGISLMPVRDALQRLTSQGLVVSRQRSGFYVRKFSAKELQEIIDSRKMFELYGLDVFFNKLNCQEAEWLYEEIRSTPLENHKVMGALDNRLHHMFIDISDNGLIKKQYEEMSCLFSLGVYVGGGHQNVIQAKEEHLRILYSIINGNKADAMDTLRTHLNRVSLEIKEIYAASREEIKD